MSKTVIFLPKGSAVYNVPFHCLLAIAFLFLVTLPSVVFCASWESVGPSGGYFLGSVTNAEDASQVTVITRSPTNVYHSMDSGASWSKISEIPTSGYILYDISAFDFSKLYAITSAGCYRSTDGGENWSYSAFPSYTGYAYYVCVDPTDSNKVYAVGFNYNSSKDKYSMVFFKSTDGGWFWSVGEFFAFDYFYPYDMAVSRSDPNVIYAAGYKKEFVFPYDYLYGALLKSSDGGDSWEDISSSAETEFDHVFYSVAIDPTDADKVYVGGYDYYDGSYDLYRTVKTGYNLELSWTLVPMQFCATSIGIDPVEPSSVYVAGFKYVDDVSVDAVGVSTDYGQSWTIHDDGIKGRAINIEVAPAANSTIYLSTNNGLFKSLDSGNTWGSAHEGIHATTITSLAVAPSQPANILAEYDGCGLMGTYDSGDNWDYLGDFVGCGNVCDIIINPLNENVVLALEGSG